MFIIFYKIELPQVNSGVSKGYKQGFLLFQLVASVKSFSLYYFIS